MSMTEAEWLRCEDPKPLIGYIKNRVPEVLLRRWCNEHWLLSCRPGKHYTPNVILPWAYFEQCNVDEEIDDRIDYADDPYHNTSLAAHLVREIVGNPWRPVDFNERWLSPEVINLVRAIHIENNFEYMGILGDALEDTGCTNEDVIHHCRDKERQIIENSYWRSPRDCFVANENIECVGCGVKLIGLEECPSKPEPTVSWIPARGPHVQSCWVLTLIRENTRELDDLLQPAP